MVSQESLHASIEMEGVSFGRLDEKAECCHALHLDASKRDNVAELLLRAENGKGRLHEDLPEEAGQDSIGGVGGDLEVDLDCRILI